jgi:hypothetical protein
MKLQQLVEQAIADSQLTPLAATQIDRLMWSTHLDRSDFAALEKLLQLIDSHSIFVSPELLRGSGEINSPEPNLHCLGDRPF